MTYVMSFSNLKKKQKICKLQESLKILGTHDGLLMDGSIFSTLLLFPTSLEVRNLNQQEIILKNEKQGEDFFNMSQVSFLVHESQQRSFYDIWVKLETEIWITRFHINKNLTNFLIHCRNPRQRIFPKNEEKVLAKQISSGT